MTTSFATVDAALKMVANLPNSLGDPSAAARLTYSAGRSFCLIEPRHWLLHVAVVDLT
jgi:hypothetical protein